ncbi:protein-(glutamine-N5) methyltransferase, release factor-specific [Alcanivorax sp. HI0033]|uniref:peptide chain release factor N(5)-glutamine methyltransferase n=2 Tax=Alcanivorax TaxID=59753 RepID=UPI0007BA5407|nr:MULTISPECIES: peptide chain release factor N(5)-glutamine methyltransferase [unclassified Alcanivorax]KZX74707.1 protein-(glutamine-N5) methyltransferase, release factor-specific [Alcanivorax sp. HI0011]KZX83870.1 protein-(glutamine-N5) methyltransferase, release factor-specific [Alcanivorax sp. HI0013]KZY15069.1 protein-(glutamine-N5) methyltransferase, release factor-specific [Alcanivorax sp. HI0035]KZX64288.1 protein-(glutamine-N5) methyltransferase, release factor-specific [Alcanivorax s
MRIDVALRQARERLASSPSPDLDAQVLLCHVLARPRSYLFTWPERELEAHQQQSFLALLARREQGEPVAHLTGEREFFGRNFSVTPDTLIPRPDTETLVELALKLGPAGPARVVDLGTGTGAIGVTLALERPQWQVTLTDLSAAALSVAGGNARQLGAQVTLQQGSWLEDCRGPFDVIVSNPPYIDPADHHLDEGDVRFEPRSALVADQRGLADLATIITQSAARLVAGGWLLLEHGYQQGAQVRALMEAGRFDGVRTERDLGGNERVTVGRQLIVNN